MIPREQARQKALDAINEIIRKEGGQSKGLMAVRRGKCSWTNMEVKQAIIADRNLLDENGNEIEGMNPVDDMLNYLIYIEKRNHKN